METVTTSAIWATAMVGIVGTFMGVVGRPLARYIDARRQELEADAEVTRAKALERQNAAEIASRTIEEQAELKRAALLEETAAKRAAVKVHEATVQDRIAEEKAVIAARTEGRAEAARERALAGESVPATLEVLMDGYKTYIDRGYSTTFKNWLGDVEIG